MRRLVTVAVAAAGMLVPPLVLSPTAGADLPPPPPYVDHVLWAKWGDLSTLRVFPTDAGRQASLVATVDTEAKAWAEVVALSPDADQPGMYHQFECHWQLAELGQPGKVSWNLEPWRPEVDDDAMVSAGCNPGGTEEPF